MVWKRIVIVGSSFAGLRAAFPLDSGMLCL